MYEETQSNPKGRRNFVKQVGSHVIQGGERRRKADKKGGDMHEWPHDIRVREMPEHREMPEVKQR